MWIVAAFPGWLLGIAINLLADRLPRSRRIELPRCEFCDGPLAVVQASALVASLTGQTICRYCGRKRPVRGLLVELVAIVVSVTIALHAASWTVYTGELLSLALYGLLFVIDLEHRLILHMTSLPTIVIFALLRGLDPAIGWSKTLWGGFAGFLIMLIFYFVGELFSRWMSQRRGSPVEEVAFGFGDVLLGLAIGLDVGWSGVIVALFTGILAAGLFSLVLIIIQLLRRRYKPFTAIPYGPFLILGSLWFQYAGRGLLLGLTGGG